jgi:alginate O-acetyltransferase complex protein AlgI
MGRIRGIVAVPTFVTMFLSGLWHGAGNQFLMFGVLHAIALTINHAWRLIRPRIWPDTEHYHRTTRPMSWALTFLVVIVALTWFHATSVAVGNNILAGMIGLHGLVLPSDIADAFPELATALGHLGFGFAGEGVVELAAIYSWVALLLLIALVPPNTLEILRAWQPATTMPGMTQAGRIDLWSGLSARMKLSLSPLWGLATAVLLAIGVLGLNRVSEFLYWQF